jgi:hypothetical protein
MTWAKIDTGFCDDPKIERAGPTGALYYLAAVLYCKQHFTDGVVPPGRARLLSAALIDPLAGQEAALDAGLIEVSLDGTVRIPSWRTWNPPADQEKAARRAQSEGGRKGAARRWRGVAHSSPHGVTHMPDKSREEVEVRPSGRTSTEGSSSDEEAPSSRRKREPVWDGLEEVMGYRPQGRQEQKRWGKVVHALKDSGAAAAEDVTGVAAAYRKRFGFEVELTPEALAKHYEALRVKPATAPSRADRVERVVPQWQIDMLHEARRNSEGAEPHAG